jgi:hypothetical protein
MAVQKTGADEPSFYVQTPNASNTRMGRIDLSPSDSYREKVDHSKKIVTLKLNMNGLYSTSDELVKGRKSPFSVSAAPHPARDKLQAASGLLVFIGVFTA